MLKNVVVIKLATTFFDENKPKQLEFKVKEGGLEGRMGKKTSQIPGVSFLGGVHIHRICLRDLDPQTKFDRQQTSRMACIFCKYTKYLLNIYCIILCIIYIQDLPERFGPTNEI